jgi:hypothetical protein
MTDPTPDPEFEEFLKRRKPLFRADADDGLEPPPELDRIVLRRAREAIRAEEPMQVYRGPRWAAPLAIAATLLLGLAVVFQVADQQHRPAPQVTIENVAQTQVAPANAPWRSDARAWLAEIERLRAAGNQAQADAEMAEYNRTHRAFAASPDR